RDDEIVKLRADLDGILEHMDRLNEIDTTGVEPMAQVLYEAPETATLRPGVPEPSIGDQAALANAPQAGARCFQLAPVHEPYRMHVPTLPIDRVRQRLRASEFSAEELAVEALRFAEAENPLTGAYRGFSSERALSQAKKIDEALARGEDPGPLAGVPVA